MEAGAWSLGIFRGLPTVQFLVFACCNRSKTERWEGPGTRLWCTHTHTHTHRLVLTRYVRHSPSLAMRMSSDPPWPTCLDQCLCATPSRMQKRYTQDLASYPGHVGGENTAWVRGLYNTVHVFYGKRFLHVVAELIKLEIDFSM